MTKPSFMKLVGMLKYRMEPQPTAVREPIALEQRVAMALYNLASNMEYRVTANQFGSHKSTVSGINREFQRKAGGLKMMYQHMLELGQRQFS